MPVENALVDATQRLEALNCSNSYIVQAPAGSGKTGVLTQRILGLLALVEKPEEIVAITFTKKAAGEMRQRVIEAIMDADGKACPESDYEAQTWHLCQAVIQRDKDKGWNLLRHPNRLKIQTIDGFCSALVKQMPYESGMGSMPLIEEDPAAIYEKAAKQLIGSLGEGHFYDEPLRSLLVHLDNNYRMAVNLVSQMLAKRDHWLENVVTARVHGEALRTNLEVALDELVNEYLAKLDEILPTTYKQRLMSLVLYAAHNLSVDTADSSLKRALQFEEDATFIDSMEVWQIFAELLLVKGKPSLRKRVDAKLGFPPPSSSKDPAEKKLRKEKKDALMALIQTLNEEVPVFAEQLFEARNLPYHGYSTEQWALLVDLLELMPVAVGYLTLLWQESGKVDFTEVSMAALRSLGSSEEPTDLTLKYDHRISHILVDEFQDTSVLQIQLLEKLTSGWQKNDGRTLFLVGDPMQGIYSFRKADIGLFLDVWHQKKLSGVALTPLKLKTNFRSDKKVIDWVNTVFSSSFPIHDNGRQGAVAYSHSVAAKSGGLHAGVTVKVFQESYLDPELEGGLMDELIHADREANYIVETIEDLKAAGLVEAKDKDREKSFAVLVRSKSHATAIIQALNVRDIPVRAVDIDTLQDSAVIQQLIGVTRALLRPSDRIGWYSVLRSACVGLALSTLEKIHTLNTRATLWDNLVKVAGDVSRMDKGLSKDAAQNTTKNTKECTEIFAEVELAKIRPVVFLFSYYYKNRKQFNVRDAVESLWLNLGGDMVDKSPATMADADKFFALLESMEVSGDLSNIKALEQKAMTMFSSPGSADTGAVQIMSMHKSKGLEFDYVFLPYAAKRGRGDDRPLLIVDNHLSTTTGRQSMFLAALPEKGADTQGDAVYEFLWNTHTMKQRNELSRLTYVACTRAKQHLYLTGTLGTDKKEQMKKPSGSTILGTLWAGLSENQLVGNVELVDAEKETSHSRRPISVLKDDVKDMVIASQQDIFREHHVLDSASSIGLKQSFSISDDSDAVNTVSGKGGDGENTDPQEIDGERDTFFAEVGSFAHRLYKQFSDKKGVPVKSDQVLSLHPIWRAYLIQLKVQTDRIDEAIDIVSRAVLHLVECPDRAEWLFNQDCESYAEYAVTQHTENGDIEHYIIDRTFIDAKGIRWVIDYKFSENNFSESNTGEDVEKFVQGQFELYRDQLENYASILNKMELRDTCLMLYFPLIGQYYCWSQDVDVALPFK